MATLSADPAPTSNDSSIDRSTVFEVLHNERRRRLLELLHEEETASLATLAEQIAVAETDADPPPSNHRRSVYVTLRQNHVPTLVEHGLVAYDESTAEVSLDGGAADVRPYLDVDQPPQLSSGDVAIATGAVGLILLLSTWSGLVGTGVAIPALAILLTLQVAVGYLDARR